jgi:hypothetical protein
MCEVAISNAFCEFEREILVVVANSPEELAGLNYLTTSQNVITIPSGSPATVTVSVPNIPNPPSGSFSWTSGDPAAVSVVSSGHFAVITGGQKTGTAVVSVTQNDCIYPLEIIVNVVDPKLAAANPYIVSPNLITLRVGDPLSAVSCELVGGTPADNTFFTWTCTDTAVIDLYGSNETAQVRAKREGITQIRISHPKTAVVRSVLVICEPRLALEYSVTVSQNIIRMTPSDPARSVTATLLNGTPLDSNGFKWWADSYDIIDFNYSSNTCVITPKSAGSVYVHASHPKSQYTADILVQISQFSEFKFAQQSMSIAAGSQSFVNMQVPVYNFTARIDYEAVDPVSGKSASHIASASGTNSVCTVSAYSAGSAVLQAKLVNASNGIVQATAQLLVSVTPSSTPATYISYSGPTIITLEKGATRQLSASLAGLGATAADNNSLQWKTSDWFSSNGNSVNPGRALDISPRPSASGTAVNNSIQITGLTAGTECTVTVSHEKAASDIVLYIIVPGLNDANISLSTGTAKFCVVGEPAFSLSAAITNPQQNDYETLAWKLDNPATDVVILSGSGKNISVLPKNPGTAVITATVPSSLRSASVTVTVEPQRFIFLEHKSVSTYPGQFLTFAYQVSPPELTDCVSWEIADTHYAKTMDGQASSGTIGRDGTMQIMGWTGSGTTTLTATLRPRDDKSIILAKASMLVKNGWDNRLSVSTPYIRQNPVRPNTPAAENPYTIAYEVSPSVSEIHVTMATPALTLVKGTFSRRKPGDNNTYIIDPDRLYKTDSETGIGYGYIQLEPLGEVKNANAVQIRAYNPLYTSPLTGELSPAYFPDTPLNVSCDIYYASYSFKVTDINGNPGVSVTAGKAEYSKFDPAIGAFVIGDGQSIVFNISTVEEKTGLNFGTPEFKGNTNEKIENYSWIPNNAPDKNIYLQQNMISVGPTGPPGRFTIVHAKDYKGSDTPWGLASPNPVENYNDTQAGFVLAGTVTFNYSSFALQNQSVSFPVYVSIRNCPATFP